MNIYISHARKDYDLALKLAARLEGEGITVLHPELEPTPDENWAMKLGKSLENADFMVFLLTPGAFEADLLRKDFEFALGSKRFEGRVFSVVVGASLETGKDIPWILLKQPYRQIASAKGFGLVAEEIESLCAAAGASPTHA